MTALVTGPATDHQGPGPDSQTVLRFVLR